MNTKYYEEKLIHLANLKAKDFYGDDLPEPIQQRLDAELKFISKHDLSAEYVFAYEASKHLQKCSIPMTISDHTLVAFLLGLTEVDPLPPHYLCTCCGYIEFPFGFDTEKTQLDLPHKHCPICLENLHKHGYLQSHKTITIRGKINKVIFENFQNGYAVFEIIDKDDNIILCKGYMPELKIADRYILSGQVWVHEKYGDYFEVTDYIFEC